MRTQARRASATVVAALALCVATGVGSANRGIGEETGGRPVTFTSSRLTFQSELGSVNCPITLNGSLATGFEKHTREPMGQIESINLPERSCTGGTVRILSETLPWDLAYYSFSGFLPRISTLRVGLEPIAGLAETFGIGCLFEGTMKGTTIGEGVIREVRLETTESIPVIRRLSVFCPASGTVSGTLTVTPNITLSLLDALPGSTLSVSTNTVTIPTGSANGTVTVRAVMGEVRVIRSVAREDAGRIPFRAFFCNNVRLANEGTCTVTISPRIDMPNRPTEGEVTIYYENNQHRNRSVSVSVDIRP